MNTIETIKHEGCVNDKMTVKIYRDAIAKKALDDIQPEHFVEGYIQAVKDIYNKRDVDIV